MSLIDRPCSNRGTIPVGRAPPLSVRSQVAVGSGAVAHYQVWFRNAADFCTRATSNATNGVRVVW